MRQRLVTFFRANRGATIVHAAQFAAVVAVIVAAAGAACTTAPPSTDPIGFSLALATVPTPGIVPGGSAQLNVTVIRSNNFTGAVTLAWIDQDDGKVTGPDVVVPEGQTTGTMMYHDLAGTASLGVHQVHVLGSAPGVQTATVSFGVTVASAGTIALALTKQYMSAVRTFVITTTVQITRTLYTGVVTLTVTPPVGSGITATVVAQPGTTSTADVTFTIAANSPLSPLPPDPGYQIDIKASGPGTADQHITVGLSVTSDTYSLIVTPPLAPITAGSTNPSCSLYCAKVYQQWLVRESSPIAITGTGPAGLEFTIAPLTIGDTHLHDVTVSAAASVPSGTYQITLHGTAEGQFEKTVSFPVVVQNFGSYTLSFNPAPLNMAAGTTASTVVTINRAGGYTGSVEFSTAADAAGIDVTATPLETTGFTTTLSVRVGSGVSLGTHIVTVTSFNNPSGSVIKTFAVVVTAPVINTTWTFCAATGLPAWVAMQDGTTGAWTAVSGTNNAYGFNITAANGGIAYVTQPGTTDLHIFYGSKAELQAQGASLCTNPGASKIVTGTVSGTGSAATAYLGAGSAASQFATPGATTAFQLAPVPSGTLDLVGATVDGVAPQPNALKMFVRRNVNLTGAIGNLDFSGTEAVVPTIRTLTPNLFDQGIRVTYALQTSNQAPASYYSVFTSSGPTLKLFGLPVANQQAGDLHYLTAQAYSGTGSTTFNRVGGVAVATIADMPITIGPTLSAPVLSILATTPYARLRASVTVQPEYNKLVEATYQQSNGSSRNVFIQMTGAYFGGAGTVALDIPDFTSVPGWTTSWGPIAGFLTHWIVTSSTWSGTAGIIFPPLVAGTTFNSATRQGDVTP